MTKGKKISTLFMTMLMISSTANSGYAILSVVISTFVRKYRWITEEEMQDYVALVQGAPGPLAINISLVTGYHVAGFWGAAAAVLGCAIPPLVIMLLVSMFYGLIVGNQLVRVFMHGMQAGVIAMLADLVLGIVSGTTKERKWYPCLLMAGSFLFAVLVKGSSLPLVSACILIGCIMYLRKRGGEKK